MVHNVKCKTRSDMKEKIDKVIDKLCRHEINSEEAKKELLDLHSVIPSFRVGDDILIDKDYRTIVVQVYGDKVAYIDYGKMEVVKIAKDRISLTVDNR